MHCRSSVDARGAVTAELAIGIPVVLAVAGVVLGALRFGMDGITATTVASESAYAIARGQSTDTTLDVARTALPRAVWGSEESVDGVCVTATVPGPIPGMQPMQVRQCAAN